MVILSCGPPTGPPRPLVEFGSAEVDGKRITFMTCTPPSPSAALSTVFVAIATVTMQEIATMLSTVKRILAWERKVNNHVQIPATVWSQVESHLKTYCLLTFDPLAPLRADFRAPVELLPTGRVADEPGLLRSLSMLLEWEELRPIVLGSVSEQPGDAFRFKRKKKSLFATPEIRKENLIQCKWQIKLSFIFYAIKSGATGDALGN